MASTVARKIPFLRLASNRIAATTICPRLVGDLTQISKNVLDNKLVLIAAEGALPVARIAVAFRAGSRFENNETLGASHMLRIMAGQSTRNSTGFYITRNLQQVGGCLTVSSDREIICYTVEAQIVHIEMALRILRDAIQPAFKPWEITDSAPRLRTQLAQVSPQMQAVELLHKAAFRNGLGNSIFMPEYRINSLSSETLLQHVTSNFVSNRCAVLGVGVDMNTLQSFAQSLDLYEGDAKIENADFFGGDMRQEAAGEWATVAVAGQGGALLNQKEALAFALAAHACGGNGAAASCKRGDRHGNFGEALALLGDQAFTFTTLNASYPEIGLFGFVISTNGKNIGDVVIVLADALKKGKISKEDFERGKAMLRAEIIDTFTTDAAILPELVGQALLTKDVLDAEALLVAVEGIGEGDVQSALTKVGSKLAMGAVGCLDSVPYSTDLC